MRHFDVFNGDADGLCALHQLRLAQPREAELVTGVKRDNALLRRVCAARGDSVTALDISLARNHEALLALLEQGVAVEYFDHHHAPDMPQHPQLHLVIDASPGVCTSVLVDRHIGGCSRQWAVVGAFGDNMPETARSLGRGLPLTEDALARLQRLGECLNYNGYGDTESDLLYPPAALYRLMRPYVDPLRFMEKEEAYGRLQAQSAQDMENALAVAPTLRTEAAALFLLPDAAWARRIVGSFANRLSAADPARAHAVLVPNARGTLTASLRTPAAVSPDAHAFARRHGGGGRRTAAGIDDLPAGAIARFADEFAQAYSAPARPCR